MESPSTARSVLNRFLPPKERAENTIILALNSPEDYETTVDILSRSRGKKLIHGVKVWDEFSIARNPASRTEGYDRIRTLLDFGCTLFLDSKTSGIPREILGKIVPFSKRHRTEYVTIMSRSDKKAVKEAIKSLQKLRSQGHMVPKVLIADRLTSERFLPEKMLKSARFAGKNDAYGIICGGRYLPPIAASKDIYICGLARVVPGISRRNKKDGTELKGSDQNHTIDLCVAARDADHVVSRTAYLDAADPLEELQADVEDMTRFFELLSPYREKNDHERHEPVLAS